MIRISLIVTILFAAIFVAGTEMSALPLDGTKHDLSSAGTGSYKAASGDPAQGGTTEKCIFCHTPHSGNAEAPLWNRANSTASYETYTSDVLSGLGYPAAEDPNLSSSPGFIVHSKTRICLSCHDGTIALGKVVNMPSNIPGTFTEIQMQGSSVIQPSTPGFIGVNLRDDHPVAIKHDSTIDTELKPGATIAGSVRLYENVSGKAAVSKKDGNYVECTSCHNPHNNEFGNFLVETNQGSALCLRCHTKTGFTGSIHDLSAVGYSPPTGGNPVNLGATVGGVKCMSCHFPHKAAGSGMPDNFSANLNTSFGKYLLSFQEEKSCYGVPDRWGQATAPCHGNNGQAQKNIIDLVAASKTSRHNVDMNNTSSLHEATEARSAGWLAPGNTNWHVECADCHNPHTAGNTSQTTLPPAPQVGAIKPLLTSTSSLYGTGGVQVTAAPNWSGGQGTYTFLEPIGVLDKTKTATGVAYEYQICLKCHSEYAWRNSTAPISPSFVPIAAMTDQAKEFNAGNSSFHPVTAVTGRNQGTLVVPWQANRGNQTMYCSSCHNNNIAPPQGPHGSSQKFILFGSYDDTLGTAGGAQQNPGDMCMTCHDPATYVTASLAGPAGTGFSTGGLNLHASHAYRAVPANPRPNGSGVITPISYKCVDCHVRVPHGWGVAGRRAMVIVRNEGATYGAQYEAGGAGAGLIWTLNQPLTPGTYAGLNVNCTTAANCHHL